MKKILWVCIIFFSASFSGAQSWNPYVAQGIISPAPLLPVQLNGTGVVSFNVGNSGSSLLLYYPTTPVNNVKLVITLSRGVPNVTPLNPSTALTTIGGSWANMFDWVYSMAANTFTGTQNQTIPGQSQGSVTIQYKVTQNSPQTSPQNGFNVILTPPPYTSTSNSTTDDQVSSYTWTEARDFGDAPITYGSADHIIDFDNNYTYMGTLIDAEPANQPSANADADDLTGVDDEDGVTFPTLMQGYTAIIPIKVTGTYGFINAWIDWNGDGDFADAGEQIASNIFVTNGMYNLSVNVPANAFTSAPTFARFRLGPPAINSSGSAPWGEVEDYQITITAFTITGTVFDDANGMNNNFVDGTGTNASGNIYMNLVKNTNSQVVASLLVNNNGTYSFGTSNGVLLNTGYNLIITNTAQTLGNTLTAATFPANWVPTGENLGTGPGNDGTVDGKLAVNTNSGSVSNANFGLDQLPNSNNSNAAYTNPGSNNTVVVQTLTGSDPEDGPLGSGSIVVITSLANNGTLSYNGVAVTTNQLITGYNPALLNVDPINGAPVVTFNFAFVDAAGKQDPTPATATLTFSDLTITGTVFDDANGMNNNFVDGTGTNASGSIYMNLVISPGNQVVASLLANSNGTYSFGTSSGVLLNTNYNLIITNTIQTPGYTLMTATFPPNWVPTGENLGTGPGNDGTVDGILAVSTTPGSVANANFGLDQLPDSYNATATYINPGGTNTVTAPTLTGYDPEDGPLGSGSTLIIISLATNGTLYYNGAVVPLNMVITGYNPALLTVDPIDGAPVVTFNFSFADAAGKQDPTPATATLTFSDLTVAGTVFDDGNGMNNTFVDGTGTNASGSIYMNLVNSAGNQVVASLLVNNDGTYSFGTSDGVLANSNYNLIVTNATQTPGNTLTTATYPVNWVPTGENLGNGSGNDSTVDGILAVITNPGSVANANFGLDQLPNSNNTIGTHTNPGGTNQIIVPTLTGSDPEDGPLGSGGTIVITSLADNGTLYYNGVSVTLNQVIINYNPAILTLDPVDGTPIVTFNFACIDAAGKQDPTPATVTITFTLIPMADLSITKTDGSGFFTVGTNNVYTVIASNAWNDDAIGATVTDTTPSGTTIISWSALFSPGASGTNSGTGDINETVNIPGGGTVTYTVTVSIPCNFTKSLVNTASVAVPAGITDPDPENNTATDTDTQNTWTGAVSDDWSEAGNWTIGVPGCSQAITAVIPRSLSRYPVIYNTGMSAANLVIDSGAVLTINPGKDLDVCGCTAINGPDALYLKSDGTNGNASFMKSQDGTITYPNNGSAKVELFLHACLPGFNCSYHISPPVTNALSGVFTGDSMKTYSEATGSYNFITGTTEPLNIMQGYLVSNASDEIRTFHGKLNDSTLTKSLTSTAGTGNGWNLVGNPYPSEIDLSAALDWTNIDKVVYYYDHLAGNYKPYPTTVGFGLGSQYVPSMQGFFVHVNAGSISGTLKFTDDNRTTTGTVNFYKDLPKDLLWLKVDGDAGMNDEVIVYFRSDVSGGYDQDIDCIKLNGAAGAPQLCAVSSDSAGLTIDALPFAGLNTVVPLDFYVSSNGTGNYSITASKYEGFSYGTTITLEDKKESKMQELRTNPVYTFSYTDGEDPARFLLHFYHPSIGVNDHGKEKDMLIYSFNHDVYLKDLTGNPQKGEMFMYNMMGQTVTHKPVAPISLNKYTFWFPNGYYIIRVVTKDKTYTGKVYLD